MLFAGLVFATLVTATNNEQVAPAGTLRPNLDATYGFQILRPVYNDTGASIAKGSVLDWDTGSGTAAGLAAADAPKVTCAGVTVSIIPDGYWGWAVVYGECLVLSDAAVAVDTPLIVKSATGAGRVDDAAVAGLEHAIIGQAKQLAAAAGELIRAFINLL